MTTIGEYMRENSGAAVYGIRDELPDEDAVVSPTDRPTDASKLSLPIGWVVGIVITVGGFGISQAMDMAALRSDVRDIKTLMANEERLKVVERENIDLKFQGMRSDIEKSELRKALLAELKPK